MPIRTIPKRRSPRSGTNVWPGYEPLYLARDLGYLDPGRRIPLVIRAFRNQARRALTLTHPRKTTFDDVVDHVRG